jgi:hypothetical protein
MSNAFFFFFFFLLILYWIEKLIKASIEADETPFFINATAGTTVLVRFET